MGNVFDIMRKFVKTKETVENNDLDLNRIVSKVMKNMTNSDFIEKTVQSKIEETMKSIVDDVFRSWSPFGKELKAEIESQLNVNLKDLDLACYNQLVLNAVKEKLDNAIIEAGIEKIKQDMDDMLSNTKDTYTLEEIIKAVKNEEDARENDWSSMSLHIEKSSVLTFIHFDEEEGKDKYRCKYRIWIDKDGVLCGCELNDRYNGKTDFDKLKFLGALHGIDKLLFKIYAHKSKIILSSTDPEDYDLEYEGEEY